MHRRPRTERDRTQEPDVQLDRRLRTRKRRIMHRGFRVRPPRAQRLLRAFAHLSFANSLHPCVANRARLPGKQRVVFRRVRRGEPIGSVWGSQPRPDGWRQIVGVGRGASAVGVAYAVAAFPNTAGVVESGRELRLFYFVVAVKVWKFGKSIFGEGKKRLTGGQSVRGRKNIWSGMLRPTSGACARRGRCQASERRGISSFW